MHSTPLDSFGTRGHDSVDPAVLEQFSVAMFVASQDFASNVTAFGKGAKNRREPGSEGVSINSDSQAMFSRKLSGPSHGGTQFPAQESDLPGVSKHPGALLCGFHRSRAHQKNGTRFSFERLYPLAHRGRCDA